MSRSSAKPIATVKLIMTNARRKHVLGITALRASVP
jgi:hypothetical protein